MSPRFVTYGAWFIGATAMTACLTPAAKHLAIRLGMVDHPGGQSYKWHQRPTAYLGGVAIATAVALMVLLSLLGEGPGFEAAVILLGGAACAVVGTMDDRKSLGILAKLVPTVAGATLVWLVGTRSGFSGILVLDFFITILWIVVVTHAVNVIDNMDGVAVGVSALSALAVFAIAASRGEGRVALMAIAIAGACAGFLPFNFRPATVFLGDAGTLFLGFVLASLALALDVQGAPLVSRAAVPILLLGVPIFNTAVVVVARRRGHRPIMVGGTDGVAHRLVALGLSRSQAASVFWAAGILSGIAAIVVAHSEPLPAMAISGVMLAMGLAALWLVQLVDTHGVGDRETPTVTTGGRFALRPHQWKGYREVEGRS